MQYPFSVIARYMVLSVKEVASEPHDTVSLRLQLLGVLTVVQSLQERGKTVTMGLVAKEIGAHDSMINRLVNRLVDHGVLEKIQMPNRQGRGRAFRLVLAETDGLREVYGLDKRDI